MATWKTRGRLRRTGILLLLFILALVTALAGFVTHALQPSPQSRVTAVPLADIVTVDPVTRVNTNNTSAIAVQLNITNAFRHVLQSTPDSNLIIDGYGVNGGLPTPFSFGPDSLTPGDTMIFTMGVDSLNTGTGVFAITGLVTVYDCSGFVNAVHCLLAWDRSTIDARYVATIQLQIPAANQIILGGAATNQTVQYPRPTGIVINTDRLEVWP